MAYLLDTNVFIQAWKYYYAMDFCPAFWDWITTGHDAGQVFSVKKVYDEIAAGNDDLVDWVGEIDRSFFIEPSHETEHARTQVYSWTIEQNYENAAIAEFMEVADGHLVAHALHGNYEVVTLEKAGNSPTKIKIPNVCNAFGIHCITTFEMLRRARAKFILESAA